MCVCVCAEVCVCVRVSVFVPPLVFYFTFALLILSHPLFTHVVFH